MKIALHYIEKRCWQWTATLQCAGQQTWWWRCTGQQLLAGNSRSMFHPCCRRSESQPWTDPQQPEPSRLHQQHDLRRPSISHRTVCSAITAHNLTPIKRDGRNTYQNGPELITSRYTHITLQTVWSEIGGRRTSGNKTVWLGSLAVACRTLVWHATPTDSRPFHCQLTTLGKLFTRVCLCHQPV